MHEAPDALLSARLPALAAVLADRGHGEHPGLAEAHQAAFEAYQVAWKSNRQYCVPDAVDTMIESLDLQRDAATVSALEEAFGAAGRAADLRLVPTAEPCLRALKGAGVKLAIVCDVGLTPTPVLLDRLDHAGLLDLFDSHAFSEEVGVYKPDPAIFRRVLERLGVAAERAAHVGDRLRTDVGGARAVGMVSVRYRAIYDDPDPLPEADIVLDDLALLPGALATLG